MVTVCWAQAGRGPSVWGLPPLVSQAPWQWAEHCVWPTQQCLARPQTRSNTFGFWLFLSGNFQFSCLTQAKYIPPREKRIKEREEGISLSILPCTLHCAQTGTRTNTSVLMERTPEGRKTRPGRGQPPGSGDRTRSQGQGTEWSGDSDGRCAGRARSGRACAPHTPPSGTCLILQAVAAPARSAAGTGMFGAEAPHPLSSCNAFYSP